MKNMTYAERLKMMNSGVKTSHEGGRVYQMSFEETLAEFFSLGMLNGNFYQSQEEVLRDAKNIFERALKECPEYATQCAIYGHTVNKLRLVPNVWLIYLSLLEDKTLFRDAFPQIISTFDMLWDFVEMSRKGGVRDGLGRGVKRVVNAKFIDLLNDYQACRYKNTISEISKVTRPAITDWDVSTGLFSQQKQETYNKLMKYVAKDELSFERIIALKGVIEAMQNGLADEDILAKIKEHRLQLEELKHATGNLPVEKKQAVYASLYEGLNYAALVRNLVALERVFATDTQTVNKYSSIRGHYKQSIVNETDIPSPIVDMVAGRLNDTQAYSKCNMLPFALFTAEKMCVTPEFKQAIGNMLRNTAESSFVIDKNIDIMLGVDTSGSMEFNMVNDSVSCMEIATLFGALIKKSHVNTKVFAVASQMEEVNLCKQDNVFDMAREIQKTDVGCGTRFEQIMQHYNGQKYIILITDNEPADNLEKVWLKETNKPKGAKLIIWKMVANQNKTSNDPSVAHVFGYSDAVLGLIKNIIEDKVGQVDEIKKIVIKK